MEVRQSEKAAASYRVVRLIGLAQVGAIIVYVLVVELMAAMAVNPPHAIANADLVRAGLLLAAVAIFLATGRVRERMLAPGFESLEQALVPGERLRRMVIANVVVFALCDVVALFGLVLFFLGGGRPDFYIFAILAVLFIAIRFPRSRQWQDWYAARNRLR